MAHWIARYAAVEGALVAAAVGLSLWQSYRRRRPRSLQIPPGFERTEERFVDPTTGIAHVVWFNPQTGKRLYQPLGRAGGAPRD